MTRSAAEIGAGLAPARAARPIRPGERIHVVGAAGAGASAAALLAHAAGAAASGCDPGGASPYTAALEAAGIPLAWSHAAAHVGPADAPVVERLAVTKALTSVAPDHPELVAARAAGVATEPWQQVIADAAASQGGRLVAVAGTHGKSTSTGWLVHVLVAAGADPAAFVGALLPAAVSGGIPATARWGHGSAFVVEADEYAGNFDPYRPDIAVLLDVEWDHPDVFADETAVRDAFRAWLAAPGAERRTLVANVGDPGTARLLAELAGWPGRIVRVALAPEGTAAGEGDGAADAAVVARLDGTRFTIDGLGAPLDTRLPLPGRHNAANALCVAVAAAELGLPVDAIAAGLASFPGVGRRLEVKGEPRGVLVLDDYGHHPTAIAATLAAVRTTHPGRRVWAVYEPLTYHRTAAMVDAFADVLATADEAVVADIWAGRDPDTTITSADALAAATNERGGAPARATGSVEATADWLATRVRPGDVVLVMGGGRSYVIADRLVATLSAGRDG
ncbi:MAG: cyanophycin synthetase [Chloroflexota bacterium]